MLYVDTSILVAALTAEIETDRIQAWLTAQPVDQLTISDWTLTEFSAALSMKVRTGQMSIAHRNLSLAGFNQLIANSFEILLVTGSHFRTAARLADRYASGLRAGDALHLAIAIEYGATLSTLDKKLAEAGAELGAEWPARADLGGRLRPQCDCEDEALRVPQRRRCLRLWQADL